MALPPRPVVAVFGLRPGCGATVVARALAVALAACDPARAAAVSTPARSGRLPLATRPAARLAARLADVPGATARALGQLALVVGAEPLALADTARHHAPLVLDAGSVAVGGAPAAVADAVVLVASPRVEPALAAVVAAGIERVGPAPLVVLNRSGADVNPCWAERATLALPSSRVGAQLALGGWAPRGSFGDGVRWLADACAAATEVPAAVSVDALPGV
jgi:hypothetical protein